MKLLVEAVLGRSRKRDYERSVRFVTLIKVKFLNCVQKLKIRRDRLIEIAVFQEAVDQSFYFLFVADLDVENTVDVIV